MLFTYIIAVCVILTVLGGWIGVQHLARNFAQRHPEYGPPREEGAGCGMFCFCRNRMTCPKSKLYQGPRERPDTDQTL